MNRVNGAKPRLNALDPMTPILQWMNATSNYAEAIGAGGPNVGPVPAETAMTNLDVLAAVIARNGFKAEITGWGNFSGPFGLTQKDAFLLMNMGPYLQGMMDYARLDSASILKEFLEPKLKQIAATMNIDAPDEPESEDGHDSDCATHDGPAAPTEDCDCGDPHAHDILARDKGEDDGA